MKLKIGPLLIFCIIFSNTLFAQTLSSFYQIVVGGIGFPKLAPAADGSSTFVFGRFDNVNGQHLGALLKLNAEGKLDANFKKIYTNGHIGQVIQQADGKIIITGEFTTVNNLTATQPVRLLSDGSVDQTFNSEASRVERFAIQSDGKVVIVSEGKLKRLNADGSLDNTFLVSDFTHYKYQIKIGPDDKIYIANIKNVMRLEPWGASDATFYISPGLVGGEIRNMVVQSDNSVFVCGSFDKYSNVETPSIARILPDGHLDLTFTSGVSGFAESIAIRENGNMLVAGSFYLDNKTWSLIEVDPNGKLQTKLAQATDQSVAVSIEQVFIRSGNALMIAGFFEKINGVAAEGFTRIDSEFKVDPSFRNHVLSLNVDEIYPPTYTLAPDNSIWLRSTFFPVRAFSATDSAEGEAIRIYPWGQVHHTKTVIDTMKYGLPPPFFQNDGKLLIPEVFIRLNEDGSKDGTFTAKGVFRNTQYPGQLYTAIEITSTLYVGGRFTSFNDTETNALVALNMDGSLKKAFTNFTANSVVTKIVPMPNGSILLAGSFDFSEGTRLLIKIDSEGVIDGAFNYGKNMQTQDIDFDASGRIYISGYDYSISRWNIIRLLADGEVDPSFAVAGAPGDAFTQVEILDDGRVAIGGMFNQYQGVLSPGLIFLDQEGNVLSNNNQIFSASSKVYQMWEIGNALYVRGQLTTKDLSKTLALTKVYIDPPLPPPPPAALSAVYSSPGRSKLTWTNTSVDGFWIYVERRRSANDPFQILDTLRPNAISFFDTVQMNTEYTYRIRTLNDAGYSEWSNHANYSWRPLPEGSIELVANKNASQADLQWTSNVRYHTGFIIQRAAAGGSNRKFVSLDTVSVNATKFVDLSVPRQSYVYRIIAYNDNGSITSNEVAVLIPEGSLVVTGDQVAYDAVLQWQSTVQNHDGYVVQRALITSAAAQYTSIATVSSTTTTYADAIPRPLKSHLYRIVAFNSYGELYSNEASVLITALENEGTEVEIFPNPTARFLTILNIQRTPEILNAFGQPICFISTTAADGNTIIDLNNVSEGIYFVKYWEQDLLKTKKIVVDK